jgi:hypothetical protein
VTYTGTGDLTVNSWSQRRWFAFLDAQLVITYACTDCVDPMRTIKIQGRLWDGSWRTIKFQTYPYSEHLTARVRYAYDEVRVVAPAIDVDADTTYAEVVSNSVPVPTRN